eukprot:926709-Amphidinium_carterae.1
MTSQAKSQWARWHSNMKIQARRIHDALQKLRTQTSNVLKHQVGAAGMDLLLLREAFQQLTSSPH